MKAPTPKFFRFLRTIGLSLAAASGAVLVAPVPLPEQVKTATGYLAVAGSVATAVSQTAVKSPEDELGPNEEGSQ